MAPATGEFESPAADPTDTDVPSGPARADPVLHAEVEVVELVTASACGRPASACQPTAMTATSTAPMTATAPRRSGSIRQRAIRAPRANSDSPRTVWTVLRSETTTGRPLVGTNGSTSTSALSTSPSPSAPCGPRATGRAEAPNSSSSRTSARPRSRERPISRRPSVRESRAPIGPRSEAESNPSPPPGSCRPEESLTPSTLGRTPHRKDRTETPVDSRSRLWTVTETVGPATSEPWVPPTRSTPQLGGDARLTP